MTLACDFRLKGLGYGSRLLRCGAVSSGKTLHLYVHSLDPGVNRYLCFLPFISDLVPITELKWQKGTKSILSPAPSLLLTFYNIQKETSFNLVLVYLSLYLFSQSTPSLEMFIFCVCVSSAVIAYHGCSSLL